MPFRAGTPFLRWVSLQTTGIQKNTYQCPFGLELHFYWNVCSGNCINSGWYQCPFGLELHFYQGEATLVYAVVQSINALSGWNSISTTSKWLLENKMERVSMPFRAGTPFLRYPFESLGFMRFLEPVFAGIYQNILTMAIFRVC